MSEQKGIDDNGQYTEFRLYVPDDKEGIYAFNEGDFGNSPQKQQPDQEYEEIPLNNWGKYHSIYGGIARYEYCEDEELEQRDKVLKKGRNNAGLGEDLAKEF